MIPTKTFFKPNLVCNGCFQVVLRTKTVTCGNACMRYCMGCVRKSVEFALKKNKLILRCLSEDCDNVYHPTQLKDLLPEPLYFAIQHKVGWKSFVCSEVNNDFCDVCAEPILMNPNSWYEPKCLNPKCSINKPYINVKAVLITVGMICIPAVTHFCLKRWVH